ncbi:MAG: hypothetical protein KGD64_11155, partial [Candidatus Heimdallarchaeota archaeon]|nr:hypothetical protein [Candidatus Heimdallarchaeota archaeon]
MSYKSNSSILPLLIRVGFGLVLPLFLEILIYIVYTGLRTGDFQFSAILLYTFLVIPILLIYLLTPKFLFQVGGVKKHIKQNLKSNYDKIFLKPRKFRFQDKAVPITDMEIKLHKEEHALLEQKIKNILIPELSKEAQNQYTQNFIDRSHTTRNEKLLTYNESLFLFSLISSALLLLNLTLVIILRFTSIELDFIVLDQLTNIANVIIFASIFGVLLLSSLYLMYANSKNLCSLIPKVLPIIYYEPEEEREKRITQILAIAEFPVSNLFVRRTQRELFGVIDEAKKQLLFTKLVETISWYYRDEMAKSIAWKLYKEVLEEIQIPEETKEKIEKQFKYDPLSHLISSQILTSDEEQAIKADIDYINEKIVVWDKTRSEEQTLSFLLIYRTLETIFRRSLSSLDTD